MTTHGTTTSAPADPAAFRVLIADDDSRVRHALRELIESDPSITVACDACTSSDVLECDAALRPSVILLDLILPQAEDGISLLKLLTRTDSRPVVAMSLRGYLRDQAIAAGAWDFVEKGSAPDVLLAALHGACDDTSAQRAN